MKEFHDWIKYYSKSHLTEALEYVSCIFIFFTWKILLRNDVVIYMEKMPVFVFTKELTK